jgi:hypothetical protein
VLLAASCISGRSTNEMHLEPQYTKHQQDTDAILIAIATPACLLRLFTPQGAERSHLRGR